MTDKDQAFTPDEDYVCEDYGAVKEWTQLRVTVPLGELDDLVAMMSMINNNLMIEDYSDIDTNLKTCYGDLIDEKILQADKSVASVSVMVSTFKGSTFCISLRMKSACSPEIWAPSS